MQVKAILRVPKFVYLENTVLDTCAGKAKRRSPRTRIEQKLRPVKPAENCKPFLLRFDPGLTTVEQSGLTL